MTFLGLVTNVASLLIFNYFFRTAVKKTPSRTDHTRHEKKKKNLSALERKRFSSCHKKNTESNQPILTVNLFIMFRLSLLLALVATVTAFQASVPFARSTKVRGT